jgi:16S rRNA G966 N2-methylase RsmD
MSEIQDSRVAGPAQANAPEVHAWHYDMLIHHERSQFYNDLIQDHCRDKIVLEIGTGSGLLAVLAVQHGAKRVICCEENPLLAMAAAQLFQRLGVADRIDLICKNSKNIKTEEIPQVDVILHELFGSDPFEEEMVPTLRDAKRFLKPDGIFLPEKIQLVYQPVVGQKLLKNLSFGDIQLTEMAELLSQVHPVLRARVKNELFPEGHALPPVSIADLLETSYTFTETNENLVDVDAVEISFRILHKDRQMLAASFDRKDERVHWFPLMFYKVDPSAKTLSFSVKDHVRLLVL